MKKYLPTILSYLFSFGVLIAAWFVAANYIVVSVLFPSPQYVAQTAVQLIEDGTLPINMWASLQRILTGFCIGSLLGVPIGLLIGSFRPVRMVLEPWTEFLRFIPATAMITTAVIWFGIGEGSKIFLLIYSTIFIIIINVAAGVGAIEKNKIRAAQALGASKRQIFLLVAFPATVPFILTGMRLAMANSFTTIVAAEMVSAETGLGVMIWTGRMFMLVNEIFVALVCLGLLGFLADRLFRTAILKFAGRYVLAQ